MRLSGKAYEQRLAEFSRSTLALLMEISPISIETARATTEITANSELSEEQVVAALKRLKHEFGIQ